MIVGMFPVLHDEVKQDADLARRFGGLADPYYAKILVGIFTAVALATAPIPPRAIWHLDGPGRELGSLPLRLQRPRRPAERFPWSGVFR